jgi:hypothetical protein
VEFAVKLGRNPTTEEEGSELNRTAGNLEVLGSKCIESKSSNNDGSELLVNMLVLGVMNQVIGGHTLVNAELGT